MVEHISGELPEEPDAEQIINDAPIVDVPQIEGDTSAYRAAYAQLDHNVNELCPRSIANHQANDLFSPPVEFGGGSHHFGGSDFGVDPYSNPTRYGNTSFGTGDNDNWGYKRSKHMNADHRRIAQCIMLYKTEGIVQTIVHLLADFTVENIDLVHEDITVHNFYQAWKTKVKLKERLHRFTVDLLQTGNVFIWTREAKLKTAEKTTMKRGLATKLIGGELVIQVEDNHRLRDKTIKVELADDQLEQLRTLAEACENHAEDGKVSEVIQRMDAGTRNDPTDPRAADRHDAKSTLIPWDYVSLNPLQMEPRGSRFANEHHWVMLLSERDMKPLSRFMNYRHYSDIGTTKVNLPEIFKGKLTKARKGSGYAAELALDEKRLSIIQDITKADYEDWATPQIFPAVKEVAFKRLVRAAEISAVNSMKHSITLIKLGKVQEGFIPRPEQLERVASALAGGSQVHHLVWDDLISGEVLQPDIGKIMDPKKYVQIDKDIYSALGVSESVMTGSGSFANSFMSIKLLLEKLETIRCKLEDWLRVEIKKIADAMKFRRLPIIKWGLMNLRDENSERKLWLDLYDRGIVSDETMLEQFGTDFDIETERQKYEKKIKVKENPAIKKDDNVFRPPVMVSQGPFKNDTDKPKPKPAGVGGRPVKTGTPQTKKRTTKPKGMGAIIKFQKYKVFATNALKTVSNITTKLAVDAEDVRDSRSLTKAQKLNVESLSTRVLASLNPEIAFSEDLVYDVLKDNDRDDLTENHRRIVDLYSDGIADVDTKEERLDLICNAFAAIHAELLEDIDEQT